MIRQWNRTRLKVWRTKSIRNSSKARIERILAVRDPSGVNRIVKEHDLPVIAYLTKGHTLSTFHLVLGPVCAGFIKGIVIRCPGASVPGFTGNVCYRKFSWHALHQFVYEERSRKNMDVLISPRCVGCHDFVDKCLVLLVYRNDDRIQQIGYGPRQRWPGRQASCALSVRHSCEQHHRNEKKNRSFHNTPSEVYLVFEILQFNPSKPQSLLYRTVIAFISACDTRSRDLLGSTMNLTTWAGSTT